MPSHVQGPVITVGADPELFLANSSGEIVSAHNILPGTKEKPYPVPLGAIQVDGVAAEFNINPCKDAMTFYRTVEGVLDQLRFHHPKFTQKIQPVCVFPKEYWDKIPSDVKQLGCDPDFNAWTGQVNPPPNDPGRMRTAAGHIHVGWTNIGNPMESSHFDDCCLVAKQMDYYMGVFTLLWDNDSRRRNVYGKAGAFRPKPYGIEYRTPSNMWLRHPKLYTWMWNSAYNAVQGLISGESPVMSEKFGNLAEKVINESQYDFVKSERFKNEIYPHMNNSWPVW